MSRGGTNGLMGWIQYGDPLLAAVEDAAHKSLSVVGAAEGAMRSLGLSSGIPWRSHRGALERGALQEPVGRRGQAREQSLLE